MAHNAMGILPLALPSFKIYFVREKAKKLLIFSYLLLLKVLQNLSKEF